MSNAPIDAVRLGAITALFVSVRFFLIRELSGRPWEKKEVAPYSFLIFGVMLLLAVSMLSTNSGARLPICVLGIGCLIWAFLLVQKT